MTTRASNGRKSIMENARVLRKLRHFTFLLILCCLVFEAFVNVAWGTNSQTTNGEIERRPSPTFRRRCLAGANAGNLCKQNSECPGSTCADRNVFNITVAVLYNAPAADITAIRNMISEMSATLLDVTDGQAQIGTATIHNNTISGYDADLEVSPSANPVWWQAHTGLFRTGGTIQVSIDNIMAANPVVNPGVRLAHEFSHLVFDSLDEYETRNAGCGSVNGVADCPVPAAGNGTCLMDSNGTEFCWGQGNSGNPTDLTGGDHDPTNVTEQSVCRSNRSCWNQLIWSWPTTFLMPTGAPDPGSNGVVVNPTNFIVTNDNVRVVLVLDESGSMGLESPSRMQRLKVAAGDFIATAEDGTEVGLVSFASDAETTSGRANVAITALATNRSALTTTVDDLKPSTRTNIGAGLQKAKDAIIAAGGVTANTYIILMTDGLNNEPAPAAAADLQAKKDDLLASGIPVYVTCTGGDLGLQAQCAEIAAGTNGFNSDSAEAARLPKTFIDFQERISGHQGVSSVEGNFAKLRETPPTFFVDEGSESASFSLLWDNAAAGASVTLLDPAGNTHRTQPIPQGLYARIDNPVTGEWRMRIDPRGAGDKAAVNATRIDPRGVDSRFVASAYVLNRVNRLVVSTRWPTRKPGEEIYVFAFPKSKGGSITLPGAKLTARVTRPDGSTDTLELTDNGRDAPNHGDDIPGDGVFTGVYKNTTLKGAYGFQVNATFDKWQLSSDAHVPNSGIESPRFMREARVSAAAGEQGDVPKQPEDDRRICPRLSICCCLWHKILSPLRKILFGG